MKNNGSLGYLTREGMRNLYVNRLMSIASVSVLFSCMVMIGVAFMIMVNINMFIGNVEDQNVIMVFVDDSATKAEEDELGASLRGLSNVRECTFVGKDSGFAQLSRRSGMYSANDYEMFRAFDMEYDYDIREIFDRYLKGETKLSNYIDALNFQDCVYPAEHIKMRCLENHDQPRICSFVKDSAAVENFSAFLYFLKGTTLIYAGQEYCCEETPSLFEKDVFPRAADRDISPLLKKLCAIKKELLSCEDDFKGSADDAKHIAILKRDDCKTLKLGIFSLHGLSADVKVELPDGEYTDHYSGGKV